MYSLFGSKNIVKEIYKLKIPNHVKWIRYQTSTQIS